MEIKCRNSDKKVKVKLNYDDENDRYSAYAVDDIGDVMGYIHFNHVKGDSPAWLEKIFVEEKYRFLGVGQTLLDLMEYVLSLEKDCFIEGRFFPENAYAENFYKKNNYLIEYGSWNFIYKNLNREKVLQEVSSRIFNYEKNVVKVDNEYSNNKTTINQIKVSNFQSLDNKILYEKDKKINKTVGIYELELNI